MRNLTAEAVAFALVLLGIVWAVTHPELFFRGVTWGIILTFTVFTVLALVALVYNIYLQARNLALGAASEDDVTRKEAAIANAVIRNGLSE
jgi:uncharacterized membrane protein